VRPLLKQKDDSSIEIPDTFSAEGNAESAEILENDNTGEKTVE
jgi:hypothetical protein